MTMTYRSTVILSKEGKWFVAKSAELGVVSQGRTIENAKKNLKEAIELYLEDEPAARQAIRANRPEPLVTSLEI